MSQKKKATKTHLAGRRGEPVCGALSPHAMTSDPDKVTCRTCAGDVPRNTPWSIKP